MERAAPHDLPRGWLATTLRWLWGADDDVGLRALFGSTPATWIVLAIFSAVSICDFVLAGSLTDVGPLTDRLGISPAGVARGEWWRLLTTSLINPPEVDPPANGLQHLLANALPVVLAGPRVERTVGSFKTVVLFVVATVCGAVAIFVGAPFYWEASGGTSNAVFGFIGAALVIGFARRRRTSRDAIYFGVLLLAMFFVAVSVAALPTGTNVSHLGGFIAGSVIAAVWCARPAAWWAGAAVVVGLMIVAGAAAAARTVDLHDSDLTIRSETDVGFAPVMVTEGFGSIWVTGGRASGDVERDEVVRIDPRSGRVSARIREPGVGGLPVVTTDRVWVAGKGTIVAIDPETNRVVSRIPLSGGAWPWSLAATEDALWAAVSETSEVIRIDIRTKEQDHVAVGDRAYVVMEYHSNVWTTSFGGQTVSRLDPDSGAVLKQRRLPNGLYHAVFLDGSLWIGAQPFVYRLHPETLATLAKIEVGGDIWTLSSDAQGRLLVPQRYSRSVVVIDPKTNEVDRRIDAGLRQPTSVVVVDEELWMAMPFRNSVLRASMRLADR